MSVPELLQHLLNKNMQLVRKNPKHLLIPIQRQEIYDAFVNLMSSQTKVTRQWLEILTVKHVLPLWGNWDCDWSNYPNPEQLLTIKEERLLGKRQEYSEEERFAAEIISLTGEDAASPFYPAWCVFEAAVAIDFYSKSYPPLDFTDEDWETFYDVAKLALIAYAGRIETQVETTNELHKFWEWWYYEKNKEDGIHLPWKQFFDPDACLVFWEWWLSEAIPQAWDLALQNS